MAVEMGGSPLVPGGLLPEYVSALAEVHTDREHVSHGKPLGKPPTYLETRKGTVPTVEPVFIDRLISGALSVFIKGSEFRAAVRRFLRLG